jgi:hypothetical protein
LLGCVVPPWLDRHLRLRQNSGTILLQQALRRQIPAHAIDSKLTAMDKDERAISVSGYVHRESVKYTYRAFEKTVIYKRRSRNHLVTKSRAFALVAEAAIAKTTFSTHSAMVAHSR